jgi:hypothetical protein
MKYNEILDMMWTVELEILTITKALTWINTDGKNYPDILKLFEDAIDEAKSKA